MKLGLRIDVDTYRGTKLGVPALCALLKEHNILASFFFSVGPDNMGRHLWRLLRPTFLKKMLRSKAANLYGWDILLRGTLWPGSLIGKNLASVIKNTSEQGHEIGFHAWDHHAWQSKIDSMNRDQIQRHISKGVEVIKEITGKPPTTSATPAWRATESTLTEKEKFAFQYNSDCRGESIFYPFVDGKKLKQPQIPTTLPTYDEVIGQKGITDDNYNDYIISQLKPDKLNVLTVHAEVEGIVCLRLFAEFLNKLEQLNIEVVPLSELINAQQQIETRKIELSQVVGREGWITVQGELVS